MTTSSHSYAGSSRRRQIASLRTSTSSECEAVSALHDIVAPTSPVAQVRTDYTNFLDNSQGKFWRLQTVDVQSSTLHDTPGYDDETGVGTPRGPAFFFRR